MNKKELQKKQDELDEEIAVCPKCGKEEKWGFIRDWVDCNGCVAEDMQHKKKVLKNLPKILKAIKEA